MKFGQVPKNRPVGTNTLSEEKDVPSIEQRHNIALFKSTRSFQSVIDEHLTYFQIFGYYCNKHS